MRHDGPAQIVGIEKILTPNDVGETGSHQAGFCIPKRDALLECLPRLDATAKNPRATLVCREGSKRIWHLEFIYYNNKKFGGTRDEYRLTGLTRFIKTNGLVAGDCVSLRRNSDATYSLSCRRERPEARGTRGRTIVLSDKWKILTI